jgi:hypothetical protein
MPAILSTTRRLGLLGVLLAAPLSAWSADQPPVLWIEAESYGEQRGSTEPKFAMQSASDGACVDHGWGGRADHFLGYRFELPTDYQALHVTLRYARETAGDARVRVTLDGDHRLAADATLPSTGNWGFNSEGWKYVAVQLPACSRGTHSLELLSLTDNNNVNFDGFYLSATELNTRRDSAESPSGPDAIAPLHRSLFPLPCSTPVALPYSRRKALVTGSGLLQSLSATPRAQGMGGSIAGPGLQVRRCPQRRAPKAWAAALRVLACRCGLLATGHGPTSSNPY